MAQAPDSDYLRVGKIAMARGLLDRGQLEKAIRELGEIAYGRMRGGDIDPTPEFGRFLVQKGLITQETLRDIQLEMERMVIEPVSKKFGKYTLLREVGRGGMSVVWEAYDNEQRERVALKFLTSYRTAGPIGEVRVDDETLRRFYREVKTATKLSHPNIVRIFEVGVKEGIHYIAMDFIDGMTLDDSLAVKRFPQRHYLQVVVQVARALQHAHEKGVLHRDVKPQNILIDETGKAFVLDFGLARDVREDEHVTLSGVAIGTPSYMSPEHAQGSKGKIDPRSDLYSLGAVLYEVLTGRPPFLGDSPMEVMLSVVQSEVEPPSKLHAEIPPALEAICMKALEKEKERRFPAVGAFADELQRYLDGERTARRSPPFVQAMVRGIVRRRGLVVGGVLAISLGVAALLTHRKALKERDVELHVRLAEEHLRYGNESAATSEFDHVLRLSPKEPRALEGRRLCDRYKRAREFLESGKRRLETGDFAGAVEAFGSALEARGDFATAYYCRGLAHERLGHGREALADLERAVALAPENPAFQAAAAERGKRDRPER